MCDVLVLNYNDAETTVHFVEFVKDYVCVNHILVVDNKSTDDSFVKLQSLSSEKVIVIQNERNGGYGAGNNFGIRYLNEKYKSDYILLCNPDVLIDEQTCVELEKFLRNNKDYAIAAPFMLNSFGVKQKNSAFRIPSTMEYILSLSVFVKKYLKNFDYGRVTVQSRQYFVDVGAVSGSLFMMNTRKMLDFGMYDENIFLYCEEVVLGKKMLNNNQKIALLPKLTFVHNHSVSISKTYRSLFAKHRILVKSKIYVLRTYFNMSYSQSILAYLFVLVSFVEIFIISLYKRFCR